MSVNTDSPPVTAKGTQDAVSEILIGVAITVLALCGLAAVYFR